MAALGSLGLCHGSLIDRPSCCRARPVASVYNGWPLHGSIARMGCGGATKRSTLQRKPRETGSVPRAQSSSTAAVHIEELKGKLEESLESSETNLTDESLELISQLEKLNPTPQPANRPDLWSGPFQMLNSSMQGVLYRGAHLTIGRDTFNAFKPNDLLIAMEEVYNHVNLASPDSYDVLIPFTIVQAGVAPLKGLLLNGGRAYPINETRLGVEFLSCKLMPRDPSQDLDVWLEVFGKQNDMDSTGSCRIELPKAKGWLDVTYLDEDYRITRGNRGTVVVVKRLEAPALNVL